MTGYENAASLLPGRLRGAALAACAGDKRRAEEFRLRAGREPTMLMPEGERVFVPGYKVTPSDLSMLVEIATGASAHSAKDSLKRGYLAARGGCRLGLCGTGIAGAGGLEGVKGISSAAVRIPREVFGCADGILSGLRNGGHPLSTLIISPPGGGKTTLLRELVRRLSDGGARISLADERGEVAAVREGAAGFDVGLFTDVLTGVSKPQAVMMLLRAMNPQIIALDEISESGDLQAVKKASGCGVRLIATVHGEGVEDLLRRPLYRELLDAGIFERGVIIGNRPQGRSYRVVELCAARPGES